MARLTASPSTAVFGAPFGSGTSSDTWDCGPSVAPDLFKATIAIAPVTDLGILKDTHRMFPDASLVNAFAGSGSSVREGSPIDHVAAIKVPVLMFHGGTDVYTPIDASKSLDGKLKGTTHQLVTGDTLDHQIDDSEARAQLLRTSEEFLRKSLGL
jgi:dipeptidyl aminopeptidase/acylaminoacyl peptidase